MTGHTKLILTLTALLPSAALVSCNSKSDPGLTERIALLESELRERDSQISALQEEADKKAQAESAPSAAAPDLKAAKSSYPDFIESLHKKLASAIPAAKFDRPAIFPVEGPDAAKPIVSRVSFRITSADGRTGEMVIPLFADPSGQWQEPETDEIVAGYKAKLAAAPSVATTQPPQQQVPAHPQQQPRQQPTDVMGANRTIEVQWNDGQKPPQRQPQQAPQQTQTPPPQQVPQAPQEQQPATPKKVMPTSRDVRIDFE